MTKGLASKLADTQSNPKSAASDAVAIAAVQRSTAPIDRSFQSSRRVYDCTVPVAVHPTLSLDEYDGLMLDYGWEAPFERLGGEVIVVAPIGAETSMTTLALTQRLQDWQRGGQARGLLLADVPLKLGEHRPVPDLSWWSEDRRPEIGKGAVASVPDLVVEVLSPRTRANDLGVKRDIYEHAGVREYWRVDPRDALVIVGRRSGSELIDVPALTRSDHLTTSLLPGLEIVVAELFRTNP